MEAYNATFWSDFSYHGYGYNEDGTKFCEQIPMLVNSFGVWEKLGLPVLGMKIWDYSLPLLESVIVLVLCLWQFFYFSLKKIGLPVPKITSMMIVRPFLPLLFFCIKIVCFD